MAENGNMSFLVPIDKVFEELPKLILSSRRARLMCNGVQISAQGIIDGETYRVYDESGSFLTISEAENGHLKILKTFYQAN